MSLFEPQWTRAIVTAAVATDSGAGEVDVERLMDHVVSGEPVRALPVRRSPTLARGVYCWIDVSPSMEPFTQDQSHLVRQLRSVVGPSRLVVRQTDGTAKRDPDLRPGVPHLVLSDLGVGDVAGEASASTPEDWGAWAEWVTRDLAARVVALAPTRPSRYPSRVRGALCLLRWDRTTSVQTVLRALADVDG